MAGNAGVRRRARDHQAEWQGRQEPPRAKEPHILCIALYRNLVHALPLDELVVQDIERLRVGAHLVHVILAAAKEGAENTGSVGEGGSAVRRGTKDNASNHADDPLAVGISERLAPDDEGFQYQTTHAVGDEHDRPDAETCVGQLLGKIARALLDDHPGLSESGQPRRITDGPDSASRQVLRQRRGPEEVARRPLGAAPPRAVRSATEAVDKNNVRIPVRLRGIRDSVETFRINDDDVRTHEMKCDAEQQAASGPLLPRSISYGKVGGKTTE